jgi:hypothetical protein
MKRFVLFAALFMAIRPAPAGAAYTWQYLCGEIRVQATWRREKDNAGVEAIRFMEPLSCRDTCRRSSSCKGSALCRDFFGNIGKRIRNFKMEQVDWPPTLNGKPCKPVPLGEWPDEGE